MKKLAVLFLVVGLSIPGYAREMQFQPTVSAPVQSTPSDSGHGNVIPALIIGTAVIALVVYIWHGHSQHRRRAGGITGKV